MRNLLTTTALLGLASGLAAQDYTLTDGNMSFNQRHLAGTFGGACANAANTSCTTDHVYAFSWGYSIAGSGTGTPLRDTGNGGYLQVPTGTSQMTQIITDAETLGLFDALWDDIVLTTGAESGTFISTLTITNTSGAQLDMSVYAFADVDFNTSCCGTTGDYTAAGSGPERFVVRDNNATCGGCMDWRGPGATNFQVDTFGSATGPNDTINAGGDLPNTGLPFGSAAAPNDFTGAFQWVLSIPAGGAVNLSTTMDFTRGGAFGSNANVGMGVGGTIPTVSSATTPSVGLDLVIDVTGGSTMATLLFSATPTPTQIPGFGLIADPILATANVALTGGAGSLTLPVGCSAFGIPLATQALELDPTSPVNIAGIAYSVSDVLVSTVGD